MRNHNENHRGERNVTDASMGLIEYPDVGFHDWKIGAAHVQKYVLHEHREAAMTLHPRRGDVPSKCCGNWWRLL